MLSHFAWKRWAPPPLMIVFFLSSLVYWYKRVAEANFGGRQRIRKSGVMISPLTILDFYDIENMTSKCFNWEFWTGKKLNSIRAFSIFWNGSNMNRDSIISISASFNSKSSSYCISLILLVIALFSCIWSMSILMSLWSSISMVSLTPVNPSMYM